MRRFSFSRFAGVLVLVACGSSAAPTLSPATPPEPGGPDASADAGHADVGVPGDAEVPDGGARDASADVASVTDGGGCRCSSDCAFSSTEQVCGRPLGSDPFGRGVCGIPAGTRYVPTAAFPIEVCSAGPACSPTNSSVVVGSSLIVSSVVVYVDAIASSKTLLHLRLDSPSGQHVTLYGDSRPAGYCGLPDQLLGAFPTSIAPLEAMGSLAGTEAQGTWTLHMENLSTLERVTVKRWALYLK